MTLILRFSSLVMLSLLVFSGCATRSSPTPDIIDSAPRQPFNVAHLPEPTPRQEPRSARGNPVSYQVHGRTYYTLPSSEGYAERGIASWYGTKFHGRTTSSGEPYDMYKFTAAHRSLPLPTYVEVTNLRNGHKLVVRVNDRGPFHDNRIIDLSYAAARRLGIADTGTGLVEVRAIDPQTWQRPPESSASRTSPARSPDQSGNLKMYIQAGAFSVKQNAEQLHTQLATVLDSHPITTEYNRKDNLYRVRVGPLSSVEDADRISRVINHNGFATPLVVID